MESGLVDTMRRMTDEALALAKDQPLAIDLLLERHRGMVAATANALAGNAVDAEDYAQEGLMALLAAISSYSPEKGASFRTYAAVCIRNRIYSMMRRDSRHDGEKSLDDPEAGLEDCLADGAVTPEQWFLEKEQVSELYEKMKCVLSRQELEVLTLSAGALSYEEIGARLQLSKKSVDNALQRARHKLQAVRSMLT